MLVTSFQTAFQNVHQLLFEHLELFVEWQYLNLNYAIHKICKFS